MAVIYQHRRLDNNQIFYIGIGEKKSRATSKRSRNPHWHNTVNSVGYDVEIVLEDISIGKAKEIEKQLISLYGRKDLKLGNLVNMTDGGEGTKGLCKESRKKIGDALRGWKHTDEAKVNMSKAHLGQVAWNRGLSTSDEVKRKISESKTGKSVKMPKQSAERRKNSCSKYYEPIGVYDLDDKFIAEYSTVKEATSALQVKKSDIYRVARGERKHTKGYIFKYIDNCKTLKTKQDGR